MITSLTNTTTITIGITLMPVKELKTRLSALGADIRGAHTLGYLNIVLVSPLVRASNVRGLFGILISCLY